MVAVSTKRKRIRTKFAKHEIPKSLIYEEYDGKPMYYRGYKDVLNQLKTKEEIMGESDTQAIIIGVLMNFLFDTIDRNKYFIVTNEVGFHLKKRSNISSDIVIYEKAALQNHTFKNKYFEIPPLAVIEVDIQADTTDFGISEMDYYGIKTKKLLDFGVREVIWFFSGTKQQFVSRAGQDGIISTWERNVTLLGEYQFSLEQLLQKEGFKL
ncbi:Uma2 family endonuclease [Runella rosea]|uniref:Uma2 family endonuclease n=1 Tax=Runella rosea TaxID=2259595 RepID=A0A344TRI3_9BACT|nr:Uma2 family endonuclease [Runella rosea]AXE21254.1 Uma2 family endonuclease [Runella rosea]